MLQCNRSDTVSCHSRYFMQKNVWGYFRCPNGSDKEKGTDMKEMIKKMREERGGFTLAELLVVVAIVAVLVAIAVPLFSSSLTSADAVAAVQKKHPHVEFLRDVTMGMLEEAKADISAEDYMRAEYVIEEIQRVLDVCDALEKGDYETVGQKMYETHHGMSKLYEVSCEELDFLNDLAFDCGVTGSRVMGGGFGGCTINLVKDELYSTFIEKAKDEFKKKFGRSPKVYDVVISDGARRLE